MSTTNILKKIVHDRNFTIIDNKILQNPALSMKAKGLAAFLLSLPEDWVIRQNELQNHFTDGDAAVRSAFKELREANYLMMVMLRDGVGRITGWRTYIRESLDLSWPVDDSNKLGPDVILPDVENQHVVNRKLLSTNNTKNLLNKDNNIVHLDLKTNKMSQKELEEIFDRLWDYYPLKKGKLKAYGVFKRLIANKTKDEVESLSKTIWDGIVALLQDHRWRKEIKEREYPDLFIAEFPHGSTWFMQERWSDMYETNRIKFMEAIRIKYKRVKR